jgi:hypothetical protein
MPPESFQIEHWPLERLLAGTVPHLMVTDPPYGVNYDASWREKAAIHEATGKIFSEC